MTYPLVPLSEALEQDTRYVDSLESRPYPKLSVKLYGRGVVLDPPVDGASVLMKRHQLATRGQVILSEIWGKKGAIGLVPEEGDGALVTSHFFLFDVRSDRADSRYIDWILRGNYLQPQLEAEAKGTTGLQLSAPSTCSRHRSHYRRSPSSGASWRASKRWPRRSRRRTGCAGRRWGKRRPL